MHLELSQRGWAQRVQGWMGVCLCSLRRLAPQVWTLVSQGGVGLVPLSCPLSHWIHLLPLGQEGHLSRPKPRICLPGGHGRLTTSCGVPSSRR